MRADVSASLQKFNLLPIGNEKNIARVEGMLWDEEEVLYITPTVALIYSVNVKKKEKLSGIFVVTNKRILFSNKKGFSETNEIFDLSEIETVNSSGNGLTAGHIDIHTRTKTLEITVSYKKEIMREIQDIINKAVSSYKNGDKVTPSNQNDSLAQVEKLHDLLKQGIITQEEFEAKKKQLLDL